MKGTLPATENILESHLSEQMWDVTAGVNYPLPALSVPAVAEFLVRSSLDQILFSTDVTRPAFPILHLIVSIQLYPLPLPFFSLICLFQIAFYTTKIILNSKLALQRTSNPSQLGIICKFNEIN